MRAPRIGKQTCVPTASLDSGLPTCLQLRSAFPVHLYWSVVTMALWPCGSLA